MARYFMTGTKYEDIERMMMSADRRVRDSSPQDQLSGGDREAKEKKKE